MLIFGSREDIKQDMKYSENIIQDLTTDYGFFTEKNESFYFLFSLKDFPTKESIEQLKRLSDGKFVLGIVESDIDKRSYFYKQYMKKQNKKVSIKPIMQEIEETKDPVGLLYKLYYSNKYKMVAGECINLVLTGKIKSDIILKVFILKILTEKVWR